MKQAFIYWFFNFRLNTYSVSVDIKKQPPDVLYKKSVLINFPKRLRPETLLKKRLWHRRFSEIFGNFLRTPFLTRTPWVAASEYLWSFKDTRNLQHSFCQNENISLAIYFYLCKVYIFEKENNYGTNKKQK